jgi:glycosyltransferase involved in cell wall biosynthesis
VRILMVSPYPPARDGLAQYAVQEVKRLRAQGHDVEALSPGPSAAHHHLDLAGARGALALARRVRAYDRVIVQFHPAIFFGERPTPAERARVYAALTVAFRAAHHVEVRIHEFPHAGTESKSEALAAHQMWTAVDRITVHTERERGEFAAAFGIPASEISVTDHGTHFEKRTNLGRAEARARLGLEPDGFMFLSIGFLQPHKGFDRSVRAFVGLAEHGCRLEIVGSLRVEDSEFVAYLDDLRALAAATPGVTLREQYVSDAEFDIWIVAADALVLPYRLIWSSGVCERAALYDRPVIASRIGGLADQVSGETLLVNDDRELAVAMRNVAGLSLDVRVSGDWPEGDRAAVMAEIRARAARRTLHAPGLHTDGQPSKRSAPLRRIGPLSMPDARSARPGASAMKRVVRRLTAWQIDPIIGQVNRLQQAAIEAMVSDADRAAEAPKGS